MHEGSANEREENKRREHKRAKRMSIFGGGKQKIISVSSQNISFNRRSLFLGGAQAAIGMLLAGRMAYIAVAENERYQMLSESNRVNLTLVPPRRGWIIDRNGKPIASNRADFRVDAIPDRLVNPDQTLAELAKLLKLSSDDLGRIRSDLEKARGFQPVEIASGLRWEDYAAVSVRLPDLPGIAPIQGFSRQYPTGAAVGHLVGYVGTASAEEYDEEPNPLLITPGFKIGKDGLEKQFEQDLRGKPGARRVEVTARGKVIRDLSKRDDVPGNPIKLTIDSDLQHFAARRLGEQSGSVIVMDCKTGELLCMASMPSFNPNSFSDGIGFDEYAMLREDDHVPLRNKSLRGLYPPASTVKPMAALAFLEAGIKPEESVYCNGGLRVGNRRFRCHSTHGRVDMKRGVAQSCDVYFYHFAQRVGMNAVAAMARKLGMGQQFPLPVTNQFYGTVPDPAWKERKYKKPWQAYDTVNSSIGQGYFLANPLQLAVMSARLGSGLAVMPHLLKKDSKSSVAPLQVDPRNLEVVRDAMHEVVHGAGTARRARLPIKNVELAGKTGTAQVVGLERGDGRNVPWKYRDHGMFICFAPYDNPRYACSVVIEHGGGSGAAYPIARDVLTFVYDRKRALDDLEKLEDQWGGTIEQRTARKFAAFQARKAAEKAGAEIADNENAG